jgi:hypothetical protein
MGKREKKQWLLEEMFENRFPQASGREEELVCWLAPGLGPVSGSPGSLCGHTTGLRLVGECLLLLVLKSLSLGGS